MATRCRSFENSWQLIKEATRKVCRGFMMDGTTKLGDSDAAERCDASKEPKMFSNHSNFKHNQTVLLLLSSQSPPCLISRPSFEARQLWSLLDKSSVWNTIYTVPLSPSQSYDLWTMLLLVPNDTKTRPFTCGLFGHSLTGVEITELKFAHWS